MPLRLRQQRTEGAPESRPASLSRAQTHDVISGSTPCPHPPSHTPHVFEVTEPFTAPLLNRGRRDREKHEWLDTPTPTRPRLFYDWLVLRSHSRRSREQGIWPSAPPVPGAGAARFSAQSEAPISLPAGGELRRPASPVPLLAGGLYPRQVSGLIA